MFYVSPESVYVWTTEWSYNQQRNVQRSMVYRMPLDGTGPSALGVSGSPVDQFSFLESGDKHLNVLVRSNGSGDGMWGAERTAGEVALLRVPVSSFNDGTDSASSWDYHGLPKPAGYTFQNRFVGDYLLYGTGSGWGAPQNKPQSNLYAVRWADGDLSELKVNHGVDRIEALGSDAIVVGTDGSNLRFSAIRLADLRKSPTSTFAKALRKASFAVTVSSTSLMDRIRACSVCRSVCRDVQGTSICSRTQRRFSFCATTVCTLKRSANSGRNLRKPWTISAAHLASIGTATRGRCLCAAESSQCSDTNSSKAQ